MIGTCRITAVAILCIGMPMAVLAADLPAATWIVDPGRSRLGFSGTQTGARFDGVFRHYDAQIQLDPAHPQSGHALVVIDMASASTGDTQRDEAIPGSDWFDIKDFPKATFEAAGFQSKGGNAYLAPGTLTLRGIRHDVALPFVLTFDGNTAHAKGRIELVRTQFGVGQGPGRRVSGWPSKWGSTSIWWPPGRPREPDQYPGRSRLFVTFS